MMRNPEQTIGTLIDKQSVAFIASVDDDGFPNMKAMLPPRKRVGIKEFWFTTNTSSMRVAQYKTNPKACIYFYDKRFFRGVQLVGSMEVLTDLKSKEMIWQEGDTRYYSGGATDPDYCVLKFTAHSGRYYSNFSSEDFKIHSQISKIREITSADYPLLNDFLYNAIYIPQGGEMPPCEIIFEPEIFIYIDSFGNNAGDHGIVAEQDGIIIGMAWTRIIDAYGHMDNETPELAISVLTEYRGNGIGTMLMTRLFSLLREHGYSRTSLSVQKDNPAVRFYERLGYKITDERLDHAGHEDYIMLKELGVIVV